MIRVINTDCRRNWYYPLASPSAKPAETLDTSGIPISDSIDITCRATFKKQPSGISDRSCGMIRSDSRTWIIERNESQDDTDPNGHFRYLS